MTTLRNYKPNNSFFREFAVGPELRGIVRSVAEDAKVVAEELSADVVSSRQDSGDAEEGSYKHYNQSFEASTEIIDWVGEYPGPRVVGRLTNTSEHAAAVEWGNTDVVIHQVKGTGRFVTAAYAAAHPDETVTRRVSYPAHRVLGRTLDALADLPFGRSE